MAAPQPFLVLPETRPAEVLAARYSHIRGVSLEICAGLQTEDFVVQSMPDASPTKWHLAHTSWFFEQFLLKPQLPGYRAFHPDFEYLFNSYYQSVGRMHERPQRGLLTRPTVEEVLRYRAHVDEHMQKLFRARPEDERLLSIATLGVNHEQQHQELMLTDIKHLFSRNPLLPAYRAGADESNDAAAPMHFIPFDGGIREIGSSGKHFCFDNELPRHRTLVEPYALADRLVTNGEYLEFMHAGGYRTAPLWLSEGWRTVQERGWQAPLYWERRDDAWWTQTLGGPLPLDPHAPVAHVSYFEADAYARWHDVRLPTEHEWEHAAAAELVRGNFQDTGVFHPLPIELTGGNQMFGDVWEWTQSAYAPYPGYRTAPGAVGEYNGKFMVNQMVLRGGSCVTPQSHIRASYRNFFPPDARWQFSGIRLASDA